MEEYPFAHVVDKECAKIVCSSCMQAAWERDAKVTLSRCAGCKFVHYCNSSCQKKDWPRHKMECTYLKNVSPLVPESIPRLMGRIIGRLQSIGDKEPAFNGRLFASLQTHATDVENDEDKLSGYIAIAHVIKNYLILSNNPPSNQIFEIFCKVLINAFVVTDACLREIGLAVYLGFSVLDHSCNPDAVIIFHGAKAILRSLKKDITVYSDKLRIPYCDVLDPGPTRRESLQKIYYFVCNCEFCQDPDIDREKWSLRCTKCDDGFCLYSPEDKNLEVQCRVCREKSVFEFYYVRRLYQRLNRPELWKKQLNDLIQFYDECQTVFSSYNVLLCKLAVDIMNVAWDSERYDKAVEYAEKTLLCYRKYYPKDHPSLSVRTFEYAKLLIQQQNDQCKPVIEQALKMIWESHGPESHLYVEAVKIANHLKQRLPSSCS